MVGQSTRFVEMSSQDSHPDRLKIGSALSDRSSDCFLCVALIGLVIWKKVNIFLSRVYVPFVPQLFCHYLCNSGCQNPFWSETDLVPFFCRSELFTGSPFQKKVFGNFTPLFWSYLSLFSFSFLFLFLPPFLFPFIRFLLLLR